MPFQIECHRRTEYMGQVSDRKYLIAHKGWTITLATRDEALKICHIVGPDPSRPYILSQGELDRPYYNPVEGGLNSDAKSIAEVIKLLGEQDYYNENGDRRSDEEIYGDDIPLKRR